MDAVAKQKEKKKFGQYFTPKDVAEFMVNLASVPLNARVLEPSCGEGVFLECLIKKGFKNIKAFEIDEDLSQEYSCVSYQSFVSAEIKEKYDFIIGNPPYIRWKNLENSLKEELARNTLWNKYCNSLCDYLYIFIIKSIELLEENGELIFICPEYWMNTTHSLPLRNYITEKGYFSEIYHFNETPIFNSVTVSIVIFKFIKSKKKQNNIAVTKYYANRKLTKSILSSLMAHEVVDDAEYLNVPQFEAGMRWVLQPQDILDEIKLLEKGCRKNNATQSLSLFDEPIRKYNKVGDFCDIGNGLVSGLDKAFQLNGELLNNKEQQAILNVVKAKDLRPYYAALVTPYIFVNESLSESLFKEQYPSFYYHFQKFKHDLNKRYSYGRNISYWEWVFLRNFNLFSRKEKRIFVPCKERISNKNHFRFALVNECIFPTQDVTAIFKKSHVKESIQYILAYLNHPLVFDWLRCNGIVKGNIVEFSEKPISEIPFRAINFENEVEKNLHDFITMQVTEYLINRKDCNLSSINRAIEKLTNM